MACPPDARFCAACGTGLGFLPTAERRVITVLFADITGFTTLTETADPEDVHRLISNCLHPLCECVTRWGGFVDKFIGDCVMALFGAPVAYENEPERAIRAALDMHAALREWVDEEGAPLRLRIGINTGPVVTGLFSGGGARDYTAIGDTVNVASRLQSAAEPGGTLVGPATYAQTKHVFEFGGEQELRVKGRAEAVRARTVLGLRAERGEVRGFRGRRARLIGREREGAALRELWRAASGGEFRTCVVVGPPGIGKTRLVGELARAEGLGAEDVARGRCYPYARATPWEPISELLRDLHDLPAGLAAAAAAEEIARRVPGEWSSREVAALGAALGAPEGASELADFRDEERSAGVAAAVVRALWTPPDRPRLLIAEDLHWADRTSLDFLSRLPGFGIGGPLLLALVTRPPLPGEPLVARLLESVPDRIDLAPLPDEAARELIAELLGDHQLPEELVSAIVQRAAGNPLFLEEILKNLVERGDIRLEDGVWRMSGRLEGTTVSVPDSIETVLSTRIDQLDPSARRVLQYAAIVGRRFWSDVVAEALARRPVDRELGDLVSGRFVHAETESAVPGSPEFAFEHLLLQEVAYEGLLRGLRAEMHGAVAAWLDSHLRERPAEAEEWIAYHYERSDDPGRALPFLEAAATRALERGARLDAQALGDRALAVASRPEDQFRLLGLVEEVAASLGDERRRREALEEIEALAASYPDPARRAEARYRRARSLLAAGELEEARAVGEEGLELFRALGDRDREGDCATLLGRVAHLWGDYPRAVRQYRDALLRQREVGDRQGEADNLDRLGLVQVDVGDCTGGIRYFEEALDLCRSMANRPFESRILSHHATALLWLGLLDEGEAMARQAIAIAEACGSSRSLAAAEFTLGTILAAQGKAAEARPVLSDICERAARAGRRGLAARAWLALSEVEEGEEALSAAARARELAERAGLVHVTILAASREAEVRLSRGDAVGADAASARAVEGLRRHGSIQGPEELVLYTRGRVLGAVGREEEADALLREAADVVRATAARIEDAELRRRFLESVPLNRAILAAARSPAADGGGSTRREVGTR